ncbi:HET-domain-containing protein, partial [Viridothelium virens]
MVRGSDTFAQVQTWIEDCNSPNHPFCNEIVTVEGTGLGGSESKFVPTRLLRVDSESGPTVRLIETETERFQGHYTTLSHCWGSLHFITLRSHNYKEMLKDIPFADFPISFQQAIKVTLSLGIRHLWIDSLCIIQGDGEDWIREGLRMDEVYQNSYCNIAAVNARDASQGLFRDRKPTRLAPSIVHASWAGNSQRYKVVQDQFWKNELLAEPLYRRAWVFQERMLAPRILHFGGRQVFWQCKSLTACETLPDGLPRVINHVPEEERRWRKLLQTISAGDMKENDKAELRIIWRIAVESYTSCDLTKKTDKLIAIAGIAKQIGRALNEKYIAGLWANDLVTQLGWYVKD